MKYLIQNKKEFAIAIGAVVMTIINLVQAIITGGVSQEDIVAVVLAVFTMLGLYYNIPTSEENCRHTGEMRAEKAEKKGVKGEYFSEEFFDEEDSINEGMEVMQDE